MEHIIMATFPVESEAYQAFSELGRDSLNTQALVLQAMLVKKGSTGLTVVDVFDTRADSKIDTRKGGLIGGALGILAGPLGLLIGAGVGALAGAGVNAADTMKNRSVLDRVSANLSDGTTAILALVQETDISVMDNKFSGYGASITRYDAAEVQAEVDEAAKAQGDVERAARAAMYRDVSEEWTAKVATARDTVVSEFNTLKDRLKLNKN